MHAEVNPMSSHLKHTNGLGRVLLAGGTGAVGQQLLQQLSVHPTVTELRVLLRRAMPVPERAVPLMTDWTDLDQHPEWFEVDTVFCALGTTMAKAGSQAAFREVDFVYPLALARQARARGARHFLVVSALGANADSRVFYNRVKGEMEAALRDMGFESLTVARPALLVGERAEFRLAERMGLALSWLTPTPFKPVHVAQVAAGLIRSAEHAPMGLRVLDNTQLRKNPAP